MPTTEDSVLTSLNELRRLRKERRKKGHSARGAGGNVRSQKPASTAYDPMGDQVTPPPQADLGGKRMRAGVHAGMDATARAVSSGFTPGPAAATWDAPVNPAAFARMARPTSSAKPAIVVAAIFLVAAGAGYVKLQNDTQALVAEKDASIRRVEEARVQAVEAAAKTERQAQAKLKACEAKASPTTAAAAVAPAATAAVMPVSPAAAAPTSSRGRHRGSAGRHAAATSSAAPAPIVEPTAVPNLPQKKKLDNDPLAGIKI